MPKHPNVTKLLENVGKDWDRTRDARVKELQEGLLNVLPERNQEIEIPEDINDDIILQALEEYHQKIALGESPTEAQKEILDDLSSLYHDRFLQWIKNEG